MRCLESSPQHIEQPLRPVIDQRGSDTTVNPIRQTFERTKNELSVTALRAKNFLGLLDQTNFDERLTLYFHQHMRKNPPIVGVFSPEEELAGIRKLPKEQKREAVAAFKKNLARQRKAWAACHVFIESRILMNHDVPKEKLTGVIEQFGAKYGFSGDQKHKAERIIDGFYERRRQALELRQKFSDDRELVKVLTGVDIGNDDYLAVSVGPMAVDIYVNTRNIGRMSEKCLGFNYQGSALFASRFDGNNRFSYVVINSDLFDYQKYYEYVCGIPIQYSTLSHVPSLYHEYEHQKFGLFWTIFNHQDETVIWKYRKNQNPKVKRAFERFFRVRRLRALEEAKGEIVACLRNRTYSNLQSSLNFYFFDRKVKNLDYLAPLRDWEKMKQDPIYQEVAQRMLVDEYRSIIQNAVDSYGELLQKGHYTVQETSALLYDKPLSDWPKTVRRILKQKR